MDSILNSIKKMLGIESSYTEFDIPIIASINTAFMVLNQLGVGPTTVFKITDATTEWSDFIGTIAVNIEGIQNYIYFKTRLAFDPPTTSSVLTSMENMVRELEFRLQVQTEVT